MLGTERTGQLEYQEQLDLMVQLVSQVLLDSRDKEVIFGLFRKLDQLLV
jgi:hypothetical protein